MFEYNCYICEKNSKPLRKYFLFVYRIVYVLTFRSRSGTYVFSGIGFLSFEIRLRSGIINLRMDIKLCPPRFGGFGSNV